MVDTVEPRERGRSRYPADGYALDRVRDEIAQIRIDNATFATKLEGLTNTVGEGFKSVNAAFAEINSKYATTSDLNAVRKDLESVRSDLKKGVWILIAAFLGALVAVVFKTGLLH